MHLQVITAEKQIEDESYLVTELFKAGLTRLHFRKPALSLEEHTKILKAIPSCYHERIILHNHYSLCKEFDLGGVHLNTYKRKEVEPGELQKLNASILSTSCHNWKEAEELPTYFHQTFISPVFNSISKEGYAAGIDLSQAAPIKQERLRNHNHSLSLIALGGITAELIPILYHNKFDGAAMLGAIWQSPHPIDSFLHAQNIVNGLKDGVSTL